MSHFFTFWLLSLLTASDPATHALVPSQIPSCPLVCRVSPSSLINSLSFGTSLQHAPKYSQPRCSVIDMSEYLCTKVESLGIELVCALRSSSASISIKLAPVELVSELAYSDSMGFPLGFYSDGFTSSSPLKIAVFMFNSSPVSLATYRNGSQQLRCSQCFLQLRTQPTRN
jgi:hypothetical protein